MEVRSFVVSDTTKAGFGDVDFGRGKAVYGGPAEGLSQASFCILFRNRQGETGTVVQVRLPDPAMQRFVQELEASLKDPPATTTTIKKSPFVGSSLRIVSARAISISQRMMKSTILLKEKTRLFYLSITIITL
ncbi:hypothetical protein NL676_030242 [Syzygium grande]|nr:hypothetical protein NL676_030242 [Syzygium grande]